MTSIELLAVLPARGRVIAHLRNDTQILELEGRFYRYRYLPECERAASGGPWGVEELGSGNSDNQSVAESGSPGVGKRL